MSRPRGWARQLTAWLLVLAPASAQAHPEHLGQSSYLTLGRSQVTLELEQSPGPGVAARLVARLDSDGDGALSPAEQQAYAREALAAQELRIDGQTAALTLTRAEMSSAEQLATGQARIRLIFVAHTSPLSPGKHQLSLENRHEPVPSSYMAHAFGDSEVKVARQERDAPQKRLDVEATVTAAAPAAPAPGAARGKARSSDAAVLGLGALVGALSLSWRWREARRKVT